MGNASGHELSGSNRGLNTAAARCLGIAIQYAVGFCLIYQSTPMIEMAVDDSHS